VEASIRACSRNSVAIWERAATIVLLVLGQSANADLLTNIDKSAQRMTVTVNGQRLYDWPVSTGSSGYDTLRREGAVG
jgi:hypothetical protein